MKKIITILLLLFVAQFANAQAVFTQTFVDRCTGDVKVVTAAFVNGSATVAFYNRVRTFTYAEYTNGVLQQWLTETYAWWNSLSPCSTATQQAQQAQQTAQNAAQAASSASTAASTASSAATQATTGTTGTTGTTTGGTTTGGTTDTGSTNTGGTTGETNNTSNQNNSGSSDSSSGGSGSSDSGGNTEGGTGGESSEGGQTGGEEGSDGTESESSESSETESKSEESKEETKEEVKEEESKEESKEEESSEEKEEESKEEDSEESDEESSDEKEEEEKEKKKQKMMPIQLRADMMANQALLGNYDLVTSIGATQSSIFGDVSYGATAMIWSNLRQFALNTSYTKVHMEKLNISSLYHDGHTHYSKSKEVTVDDPLTPPIPKLKHITSASVGYMNNFGNGALVVNYMEIKPTKYGTFGAGVNMVNAFAENAYQQTMIGYNVLYTNQLMLSQRISYAPAFIWTQTPFSTKLEWKRDEWGKNHLFAQNELTRQRIYGMMILSNSFTIQLTRRFSFNVGATFIKSTDPNIPLIKSFMIGAKLPF